MIRIVDKFKDVMIKTYKTMETKTRINQYSDYFCRYNTEDERSS